MCLEHADSFERMFESHVSNQFVRVCASYEKFALFDLILLLSLKKIYVSLVLLLLSFLVPS